jgi:hypothetical protein
MVSDYVYNGKEYDNSFGCSFPVIDIPEVYVCPSDNEFIFVSGISEVETACSSKK